MGMYVRIFAFLAVVSHIFAGTVSALAQEPSLGTVARDGGMSGAVVADTLEGWNKLYPNSLSDDRIIAVDGRECRLCHAFANSGHGWNAYGWALRVENQNSVVEGRNSDGDAAGYSNLTEIMANAQPGWTAGENVDYYKHGSTGTVSVPELAPLDAESRETIPPTASIAINGGAQYSTRIVTLNLEAADKGGSGVFKMRTKNSGGAWTGWEDFDARKAWKLPAGDGTKRVLFQVKDWANNDSGIVSDTIKLDTRAPSAKLSTPFVSTKISKRPTFKVRWTGTDSYSGIDSYMVRYRPANSRTWRTWRANTKSTDGYFTGTAGRTYYFRVRAKDKAGNYRWSKVRKTIVPYNEGDKIRKRIGFNAYQKSAKSQNYLTSIRGSYGNGHTLVYKITNINAIGLVTTKGPNRGRAKIYVDGKHIKTVDAYKSSIRPRQLIFYKSFAKKGTHYLKIVNLGTPGRARFDVDGIVGGR